MQVIAVRTYPAAGEPGIEHASVAITERGLTGDRPKKAPVSIVGADRADSTRSNLVLSVSTAEVVAMVGQVIQLGSVTMVLEGAAGSCPGLYAAVGQDGTLAVGDTVIVLD
jgi:hypothetical protein